MNIKQSINRIDDFFRTEDLGSMNHEGIYHALRALDEVSNNMERKWGIDRLPKLVTPELAAKFGEGKAQLDQSIKDDDLDKVRGKAAMMVRAWSALDKAATEAGQKTIDLLDGDVVHHRHPETGKAYIFAYNTASLHRIGGERVYSFDEVCRILEAFNRQASGIVEKSKELFPAASVVRVGEVDQDYLNDEIPF
jgi:hypothetical protein